MSGLHVTGSLLIPEHELVESAARSGGPGGQHVNKTSTRITLRWSIQDSGVLRADERARLLQRLDSRLTKDGVLQVHADGTRSQLQNREAARARLRELVLDALRTPKPRKPTKPTRGSKERRLSSKKRDSQKKQDRRSWPD